MENGTSIFLVGGRYRNRLGEYEVLDISGNHMIVRYDNGNEDNLDIRIQERIIQNMQLEAERIAPYSNELATRNHSF